MAFEPFDDSGLAPVTLKYFQKGRKVEAMQYNVEDDMFKIKRWIKGFEGFWHVLDWDLLLKLQFTDWLMRSDNGKYSIIKDDFFRKFYTAK